MELKKFPRTYDTINGPTTVMLIACECGNAQRGPKGGVCGNCNHAILSDRESSQCRK